MRSLLVALGLLAPSVPAQTVVFQEGFESGLAGWTVGPDSPECPWGHGSSPCTGTWMQVDAADACAGWALPFPAGAQCVRFGYPGQCNLEDGLNVPDCSLKTAAPIALPAGAGAIALRFWSQSEGEDESSYDQRIVSISSNGGSSWLELGRVWNSSWYRQSYDLTPWAGQSVLLKFRFAAQDMGFNDVRGWFLDDVVVEAETGATGVAFCAGDGTGADCPCGNFGGPGRGCATSFAPAGARLAATGVPSVSGDTVQLAADGLSNSVVTFFQGTAQHAFGLGAAFGDGLRCASGSVIRLGARQASGGAAQVPGVLAVTLHSLGAVGPAGGMHTYQVWYRNAAAFCTPSTFNLTNGLILHWTP